MKMINIILGLAIFSFLNGNCDSSSNRVPKAPILFIGYNNNLPVFDEFDENTVYTYDDKFVFFKDYNQNYTVLAINDSLICYEDIEDGVSYLVMDNFKESKRYILNSTLTFYALDRSNFYYTDINDGMKIKMISFEGDRKNCNQNGYVVSVVNNDLYYVQYSDQNIDMVNANLLAIDLENNSTPRIILTNISGECTVISPNNKYIYERVLSDGEFIPIVFNLKKNEIKTIQVDNSFLNTIPFYSNKTNSFVFYNSKSFNMKPVK